MQHDFGFVEDHPAPFARLTRRRRAPPVDDNGRPIELHHTIVRSEYTGPRLTIHKSRAPVEYGIYSKWNLYNKFYKRHNIFRDVDGRTLEAWFEPGTPIQGAEVKTPFH